MSSTINTKFSRRSFLRTSSLASGGMLIGFNFFTACKDTVKMPVDIAKLNYNDFNAFIKISAEGMVTIFSPNPEIRRKYSHPDLRTLTDFDGFGGFFLVSYPGDMSARVGLALTLCAQ